MIPTNTMQMIVLTYLPIIIRPDVMLGLAMASRLFPAGEWQREREDLLLTLISPAMILRGKTAAMWLFIIGLMLLAAPVFYVPLLDRIGLRPEDLIDAPLLTATGLFAAVLEDIAFGALCVMLAVWGTLRWREPFARVIRVILLTGLIGAIIGIINVATGHVLIEYTNAIYWSDLHFAVFATVTFAAGALLIELSTCLWLWRRCMKMYSASE